MSNNKLNLQNDVILDACSMISLYATGDLDAILRCIPRQVYIASYVEKIELKALYNPNTKEFDMPIDLQSVKQNGLLKVVEPVSRTEKLDAVNFAYDMSMKKPGKNTGEAITGSIAKSRSWMMITDDVDATKFFTDPSNTVQMTTTLHIMQHWSESNDASWTQVQTALKRIHIHARYGPPPKNHPLIAWWSSYKVMS